MKTARQLLGKRRFRRYAELGFLLFDDITGVNKFYDLTDLTRIMKMNYAYKRCNKIFGDGKHKRWVEAYNILVNKNIYELEQEAMSRALTGKESLHDIENVSK